MLHTDVHSHILPGIDDGARDITVSEGIINRLLSQGVEYIAATPHFRGHRETVDQFLERRRKAYEQLCRRLPYDVMKRITVAAEVALEFGLSDDKNIKKLTYGNTDYILLELPFRQFSQRMIEEITNIQYDYGLIPVIAHIDRYAEIFSQDDYDILLSLNGVIFQINNSAFLERSARRLISRLIDEDLPFVLGSDSHDTENRKPDFDVAVRPISDYKPHPDARRFLDALKTSGQEYLDSVYSENNNISEDTRKENDADQTNGVSPMDSTAYTRRPDPVSVSKDDMRELTNSVRKISDSLRMNERKDDSPDSISEDTAEESFPEYYAASRREKHTYDITRGSGNTFPEYGSRNAAAGSGDRAEMTVNRVGADNTAAHENGYAPYRSYKTRETDRDGAVNIPKYRKPDNIRIASEPEINVRSFLPLLYFFAAAIVFSFVLPRLGLFSHVIDVSAADVYGVSDSIGLGDEGANVTALQKKLYTLGYLDFDGLTGRFDETTINAVNAVLERRDMNPVINCSRENYEMLLALTPQELASGSDTPTGQDKDGNGGADDPDVQPLGSETATSSQTKTTTTTTTGAATTTSTAAAATTTVAADTTATEPEKTSATATSSDNEGTEADNSNKLVRILEDGTRLRSKAKMKSTVMFWVNSGDEYEYLGEETDSEGTKWYKLQYKNVCTGYVIADQAELIDKQ